MGTQIICLANSYKEGGRCIAGLDLTSGKWVRPICNTSHGEVPTEYVHHIKLLDVIEFNSISKKPFGFQSENILIENKKIQIVGNYKINAIGKSSFYEYPFIFGNNKAFITIPESGKLNHSLAMIEASNSAPYIKYYYSTPKYRIEFYFNGIHYDLPVTDLDFIEKYKKNKDILKKKHKVYLVLSLAPEFRNLHYKLIAGVIF